jgi:hypothetical protein
MASDGEDLYFAFCRPNGHFSIARYAIGSAVFTTNFLPLDYRYGCPSSLAVAGRSIYWAHGGIGRASLDGTDVRVNWFKAAGAIDLAAAGGRIYWSWLEPSHRHPATGRPTGYIGVMSTQGKVLNRRFLHGYGPLAVAR